MQSTAQSWLVYRLTGSAFFLGLVSFAGSLPALAFSPFSGVLADRFKRRKILLTTQILCIIQALILIILYFTGIINKWHVLFLAVFLGIANSFDITARQTFIPLLVNRNDLSNAIALNSSMFNAARIIGPAVSGMIIASFGEGICFILNFLSYLPIIFFLCSVKTDKQEIKEFSSSLTHLKEGIDFALNTAPIKNLLILLGIFSFFGMSFMTLLPIFSDQILGMGARGLGILMSSSGIGAVIGALFLAARKKIFGIKKIIAVCSLIASLCLILFSYSRNYIFSILLLFVIGFCFIIINAGTNTAIQAMSPDPLRGRIIGLYSMMFLGMFPFGSLLTGYLAHRFTPQVAVTTGAIICFLAGIYFSAKTPKLTQQAKKLISLQEGTDKIIEPVG